METKNKFFNITFIDDSLGIQSGVDNNNNYYFI